MEKLATNNFSRKRVQEQVLNLTQIKALCSPPTNLHCLQRHDKLLETVLLMGYLGLRVSEAINFTWQQILVEDKKAFLVQGKGNKQRLVFNLLNNAYIAKKSKTMLKDQWKTISRIAVWDYLKRKSKELNLTWTNYSPYSKKIFCFYSSLWLRVRF